MAAQAARHRRRPEAGVQPRQPSLRVQRRSLLDSGPKDKDDVDEYDLFAEPSPGVCLLRCRS